MNTTELMMLTLKPLIKHKRLAVYMYMHIHVHSVYFGISLKRGQMPSAKIQGGGGTCKYKGGQPHIIKDRESQLLRGGANQSQGGQKLPLPLEINPACTHVNEITHVHT